ncbi:degenerin mec-10-like [Physella acuta]|uniref:degenerin mec-10-like n=1 Tax=Physella acuta TaxID=109671 RepID=UPI0027DE6850|nr:degenerin mec-10-like [Physella acuta]XP_059169935.1 degenerin mec-10-like [Physella acuta]
MKETVKVSPLVFPEKERRKSVASEIGNDKGKNSFGDGLRGVFANYAETATINGVNVINLASSYIVKAVWGLLLAIAIGAMIYHLYTLIDKFFQYKTHSSLELGFNVLPFPAVTICNVNIMRLSQSESANDNINNIIYEVSYKSMTEDAQNLDVDFNDDYTYDGTDDTSDSSGSFWDSFPINDSVTDESYAAEEALYDMEEFAGTWEATSEPSSASVYEDAFISEFSKLNGTTRSKLGHQIGTMLFQCSFGGRKCEKKNFTLVHSTTYGNCYTIQNDKFMSRTSGPGGGLELVLFLETDEYIPGITSGKGAQVVIHEQDTVPFPDQEGIAINAGEQTVIALKQISIERLGLPYGKCNDDTEFKAKYNTKFRRNLCQKICQENKVRAVCNCYDQSNLEVNTIIKTPSTLKPCSNKTELICVTRLNLNVSNDDTSCDCSSPCSETAYEKSQSSRQWPSVEAAKLMVDTMCKKNVSTCTDLHNKDPSLYPNDFVKLNIYFEDLNYEKISEQADYELTQMLSDVGGCIGLWIGLSLLGVFEVIHLTIDILMFIGSFLCRKK